MPLANHQEQRRGTAEVRAGRGSQGPVCLLHLSGSPEVAWLEAPQPYGLLRSLSAAASDKHLRRLQAQLHH